MGTVQLTAVPVQLVCAVYVPSLCRISTAYPVIAEPPSAGATQLISTLVSETLVVGASGVFGAVGSTAPLLARDAAEGPTAFVAITLAKTLAPFARL